MVWVRSIAFQIYFYASVGLFATFIFLCAMFPFSVRFALARAWGKSMLVVGRFLCGLDYEIDEGGGVFYGPKIDFHVRDCLRRSWQCGTIQVDFSMPERFDLNYIGSDGERHRPVMIHRALFGSIERILGVLIEHYAGNFPLWLAPRQVAVLPLGSRHVEYARQVRERLAAAGFRVELDEREEKIGGKIRDAELQKIPCMLIIGDREAEQGQVAVRRHLLGDCGALPLAELLERLAAEVAQKEIEPSGFAPRAK